VAKPAATSEAAPPESAEVAGINRLRDTAKWLIGAYAAVGTAILAGLQLTSLGKIEDHDRLALAMGAALVALIAVAVAIAKVVRVLAPVTVEPSDLRPGSTVDKMVVATPSLLKGQAASVAQLQENYTAALEDYQSKRERAREHEEEGPAADRAYGRLMALSAPLTRLRNMALFVKVQERFASAKRWLAGAGSVTAICVIAFAWAANPSVESQEKAKAQQDGPTLQAPSPVNVSVSQTRPSLKQLRDKLGTGCDLTQVSALIVGGTAQEPELITLPANGCHAERFTASQDIGIVLPASAAGKSNSG